MSKRPCATCPERQRPFPGRPAEGAPAPACSGTPTWRNADFPVSGGPRSLLAVSLLLSLALSPHFIHQETKQPYSGFQTSKLSALTPVQIHLSLATINSSCKPPSLRAPQLPLTPSSQLALYFLGMSSSPQILRKFLRVPSFLCLSFTWMFPLIFKNKIK